MLATCGNVGTPGDNAFTMLPPVDGLATAFLIPAELGTYGAAQRLHTLRTSRCAISARDEEATRNGLTPISIKRVTALGASLVCKVEKTRWPVSDALMAMWPFPGRGFPPA